MGFTTHYNKQYLMSISNIKILAAVALEKSLTQHLLEKKKKMGK